MKNLKNKRKLLDASSSSLGFIFGHLLKPEGFLNLTDIKSIIEKHQNLEKELCIFVL